MAKRNDIPEFGMLSGLKLAFSAVSVAGPFCGSMFADHGANVIWLEPATSIPIERTGVPLWLDQERRNMRSLKVDLRSSEGKGVFLKLIADLDIFVEASKGGSFDKWGLSDKVLWDINPKLIIVHISGFGLWGDPDYVTRASYDPTAQAFGGMMYANSEEGKPPRPAAPMIADFYTGLFSYGSALAAYIKMLKTGKGESIEVSQYEAVLRCTFDKAMSSWNYDKDNPLYFQPSNFNGRTAGYDSYLCGDGNYIYMLVFGANVMKNAAAIMGVEFGSEDFPAAPIYRDYSPEGIRWNQALKDYCMKHTAQEVEKTMAGAGVPAIRMLTYDDMLEHPHYKARESIIKFHSDYMDRDLYASNIFPRATNSPGQIWRQCPKGGEDTRDILEELGYTEEQIQAFIDKKAAATE